MSLRDMQNVPKRNASPRNQNYSSGSQAEFCANCVNSFGLNYLEKIYKRAS